MRLIHAREPEVPRLPGALPCMRQSVHATALIETAIVLPLYLIILFGLIYFGYASLSKQRQALAGAYAAWMPGEQQADRLLAQFWPWSGTPEGSGVGGESRANAGDMELLAQERTRSGDEYYGTLIPGQLTGGVHSLGGGGDEIFDVERLTVSLWNYALGEVTQYFEWVPGQGVVERMRISWDSIAAYLNADSPQGLNQGGGFVAAGDAAPPTIGRYEVLIGQMLDGLGSDHWLERRSVALEAAYRPPFLKVAISEEGAPPTGFSTYVSGDYPEPAEKLASTSSFDLTGRGTAMRRAVGEAGRTSSELIGEVGGFLGGSLPDPHEMDDASLGIGTLRELCLSR